MEVLLLMRRMLAAGNPLRALIGGSPASHA
jgi:hypothetical protein